jgi:hypothetical protein
VTEHLGYTFGVLNDLTAISNATDPRYSCAVTCDANNNITELDEKMTGVGAIPPFQDNFLYTYFEYDALNRMTKHKTKAYVAGTTNAWVWKEREYLYSAVGAILETGWRTYNDGTMPPAFQTSKHAYDQQTGNFVQNTNTGVTPYGMRWVWAGAQNGGYGNLFGPNSDTASQNAYTLNAQGGAGIPNRRTFINPTTEGDKRELWGQGRPMGKDSNSAWSTGTGSAVQNTHQNPVTSRLVFEGTVAPNDAARATDMREKGRIGIYGTGFSYAGSSPRVTSESLGRDLNPLGRGDGNAYVGGGQNEGMSVQNLGMVYPSLPLLPAMQQGTGNSVNNACPNCPPSGDPPPPMNPPSGNPPHDPPKVVSPDRNSWIDMNCFLQWKSSLTVVCHPCMTYWGGDTCGDWSSDPTILGQTLQKHCNSPCRAVECSGSNPFAVDDDCTPPESCIHCNDPDQCQDCDSIAMDALSSAINSCIKGGLLDANDGFRECLIECTFTGKAWRLCWSFCVFHMIGNYRTYKGKCCKDNLPAAAGLCKGNTVIACACLGGLCAGYGGC